MLRSLSGFSRTLKIICNNGALCDLADAVLVLPDGERPAAIHAGEEQLQELGLTCDEFAEAVPLVEKLLV